MYLTFKKASAIIWFLVCFSSLSSTAQTLATIDFLPGSWEQVLQTAQKEQKPIYIYAFTPSCRYCKQMEKEVFPTPAVAKYYNATFINYRINIEDGAEGEALADKFEIVGFPTYIYVDKDGQLLHQSGSAKLPDEFIQDGKNALDSGKALFSLKRRYESGERAPSFLYQYSNALANFRQVNSPEEEVVRAYLETQTPQQLQSKENLQYIFEKNLAFPALPTQYFLKNQEAFLALYKAEEVNHKAEKIITRTSRLAGNQNDSALLEAVLQVIASSFKEKEKAAALATIYFYGGKQDWLNYAKSTLAYSKTHGAQDWRNPYETAMYLKTFSKEPKSLALGVEIMQHVIKLQPSYGNLTLQAQLYEKVGQKELALKSAKAAVKAAKPTGEDNSDANELIQKINAKK